MHSPEYHADVDLGVARQRIEANAIVPDSPWIVFVHGIDIVLGRGRCIVDS